MKINFNEFNSNNEKINLEYNKHIRKNKKSFEICISTEKLDQSILIN